MSPLQLLLAAFAAAVDTNLELLLLVVYVQLPRTLPCMNRGVIELR